MKTFDVYMTNGTVWGDQIIYDEYGDKCERLSDIEILGRNDPALISVDQDTGKRKKMLNKYAIQTIVEHVQEE